MSHPTLFTTPGLRAFAEEIDAERQRQLTKWGDQHHPDGTALAGDGWAADHARRVCQQAAAGGTLAWRHILREEAAEALAESDTAKLRAELIQVAAVCAAWVADIDQRGGRS
jgi:protein involved in temperature-dependent protein secretion